MTKKTHTHINRKRQVSFSIWKHIKTYFFAITIGLMVFIGSRQYFASQPPCANSHTCESDLSEQIDNEMIGIFNGHRVTPPKIDFTQKIFSQKSTVLGTHNTNEAKHIYVDLTTQTLYAFEGQKQTFKTLISSGKWGKTPVGNFHIWSKLRATRMAGGSGDDAYNLPNVPYVMYFFHDFGLHGAYWHNNFGHTMSHGCVNLRIVDAQILFDWADGPTANQLGTAVSICDAFISPNTCVQKNPIH